MVEPRHEWVFPEPLRLPPELRAAASGLGLGPIAATVLVRRGVDDAASMAAFFAPPRAALHDPRRLPDAQALVDRIARARDGGERVMVFGDFDADGLTGLAQVVLALTALGIETIPYVPSRLDEGHGLSMAAVGAAVRDRVSLIVTVDTGSTSVGEVAAAAERGIDVVITDHHHVPDEVPAAVALVNPHRADAAYPERRLTGSGVAFTVARLLLREIADAEDEALKLADLAAIGTVSDVAPILGENRAIARLGIERMRADPRPGIAALLDRAGVVAETVDLETVGFVIAPRLNAAGRVGEALDAARLLLSQTPEEARDLATMLESANATRRDLMRAAVAETRLALGLATPGQAPGQLTLPEPADAPALVGPVPVEAAPAGPDDARPDVARDREAADTIDSPVTPGIGTVHAHPDPNAPAMLAWGELPVGIIGLVAGRIADETGRPAVIGSDLGDMIRASCRGDGRLNLAIALDACEDLLIRHGGHGGAAGFEIPRERWGAFVERFLRLAADAAPPAARSTLSVDLALPAAMVSYDLLRELGRLGPFGTGNPEPLVAVLGLTVHRVRAANGGHTQLVLRRERDVVDAIAFGWRELAELVSEGDRVDVVARLTSRAFGGLETMQLEVRDISISGTHPRAAEVLARAGERAAGGVVAAISMSASGVSS
jgi:single-stranded-DNA-specific exonuclease